MLKSASTEFAIDSHEYASTTVRDAGERMLQALRDMGVKIEGGVIQLGQRFRMTIEPLLAAGDTDTNVTVHHGDDTHRWPAFMAPPATDTAPADGGDQSLSPPGIPAESGVGSLG